MDNVDHPYLSVLLVEDDEDDYVIIRDLLSEMERFELEWVTDYEDALKRANDSRYGLQAGVFTQDLGKALRAADVLDFGGVLVNEVPTWRADQQPYGGVRDSGNTREGPHYTVREMTEHRLVVVQA